MNAVGLLLVWTALQVSALCAAGLVLYALARRRSPAAGAWVAGATIAVACLVTALAVSPWPRWWSLDAAPSAVSQKIAAAAPQVSTARTDVRLAPGQLAGPLERAAAADTAAKAKAEDAADSTGAWQTVWQTLRRAAAAAGRDMQAPDWRWPAWLAIGVFLGCGLAAARILAAVLAAQRYRRQSCAIVDPHVAALLDEVRRQLGCPRTIELRETSRTCSPATVGWLKPAIILPADWRTWSPLEQRSILAHEVAHVARGDFASWLLAQLGVALHFYNPLVHYLATRLRLEQELAADVCGAQLAGGRQAYLTTLAAMALRHDDARLAWIARPFLPTRGTLMRRVDMLHQRKQLPDLAVSRGVRLLAAASLLCAAFMIVGVRGPGAATNALAAQQAAAETQAADELFTLDFVPDDAQYVVAARPASLAKVASLTTLKEALTKIGMFEQLDLPLEEVSEIKYIIGARPAPNDSDLSILVLRSKAPHDWNKLGTYLIGEHQPVEDAGSPKYFRSTDARPGQFKEYWLPDDRTLVATSPGIVAKVTGLRGPDHQPAGAKQWQSVAASPLAVMVRLDATRTLLKQFGPTLDPGLVTAPTVLSGRDGRDLFVIEGRIECQSAEAAQSIKDAVRTGLNAVQQEFRAVLGSSPTLGITNYTPQIMLRVLQSTDIEAKEAAVVSRTTIAPDIGRDLADVVGPARVALRRNKSANKIRQLSIALHNYHDMYKRFPTATVIGPDGKTPHSWRLEMLPLLGKKELYEKYRLNEPWDSEHNRALIPEGADLFSVPEDTSNNDCGYFLLVGPGTAFDPAEPRPAVRTIRDGTVNTLGIVEAKRSIPWSKPEDIEVDPNKPLPQLGGFFPGGFDAGMLDASVFFLPDNLDEATMRALISRAGREIVTRDPTTGIPKLDRPPQ
ncbi:MAG: M56 family metallopeptidase [Pirellulales bacterium]